jgi:exosortase
MKRAGWFAALALLWFFAWMHSAKAWIEIEQYRYGWAIPPLAIFLAYRRWRGNLAVCKSSVVPLLACGFGIAIFARGVWLTWLDPSWRLTGALLTLGASVVTGSWFYLEGGGLLLRRQIFPLAFCFLALPWPKFIEHPVTLGLLKIITSAVVVFLNLCGIAAAQQGNVIQLHLHELGMETACSGIESLQAALMAAVFLGELHFLRASRRWLLAGSAVLLAMAMNFLRVSGLAILMEFSGPEAEARFHDTAGGIATAALFLVLVFAAGAGARKGLPVKTGEFSRVTCAPAWAGWCGFMAALSVMAVGAFAFGLSLPAGGPAPVLWNIDATRLPLGWTARRDALTPSEQTQRRHVQEERWHFRSPEGAEAYVIYLRWKHGTQTDATAYPHSPGLCLPTQGWAQEGKISDVRIALGAGSESVPFNGYHFSHQAARLVALQCLSSGQAYLPPSSVSQPCIVGKVLASLYRRPRYVSEDLLIYLPEPTGSTNATEMVTELVKEFRVAR